MLANICGRVSNPVGVRWPRACSAAFAASPKLQWESAMGVCNAMFHCTDWTFAQSSARFFLFLRIGGPRMCYGAAEVLTLWLEPSASELSDLRCLSGLSRGSMVSEWILISYGCSVGATQLGLLSWGCSPTARESIWCDS